MISKAQSLGNDIEIRQRIATMVSTDPRASTQPVLNSLLGIFDPYRIAPTPAATAVRS